MAVIVNDMSEVNIDAALVEDHAALAGAALSRTDETMVEMAMAASAARCARTC